MITMVVPDDRYELLGLLQYMFFTPMYLPVAILHPYSERIVEKFEETQMIQPRTCSRLSVFSLVLSYFLAI